MKKACFKQCTAALISSLLIAGCASTTTPRDMTFGEEVSYDGLRRVENTRARKVWVRPDFDLSGYTEIKTQSAGIQFRPVQGNPRARTGTEFPVTEAQKERLRVAAGEAFSRELANSTRFKVTDTPGPNVMLIRGALLDVVSNVPPERVGRGDTFVSTVGQATLVIELRDSESNAMIARIADRRAAQPAGGTMQRANSVTNSAEVRRMLSRWAVWLREGLDGLPEQTPSG